MKINLAILSISDLRLLLKEAHDLSDAQKLQLVDRGDINNTIRGGHTECLGLVLDFVKDFSLENKIQLVDSSSIGYATLGGHTECLGLVLDFVKDFSLEQKLQLVTRYSINDTTQGGHTECLGLVLNFVKDFSLEQKFQLVNSYSISHATQGGHTECLGLVLGFVKDFPLEQKLQLVNSDSIIRAARGGHIECLGLVLDFVKDFSLEQKLQLVGSSSIGYATRGGHTECLKLVLDFVKDFPLEQKLQLVNSYSIIHATRGGHTECVSAILNFAAKSGITELEGQSLWQYVQENNLEAKSQELWTLTKTWENMDEVNNRLLRNEGLGLKFFSDVVCYMVQNGKAIDSNTIPDTKHKKEILSDIVKLFRGEKDGYEHKVFQDMASLNGVEPAERIKAAVGILTMRPEEKQKLILVDFSKGLPVEITVKITSKFLKDDESLTKILTKFGDRIKETLLNPAQKPPAEEQKKNSLTQSGIGCPQEDHEADNVAISLHGEMIYSQLIHQYS